MNFLKKLETYFRDNTEEKILSDWEKTKKYDEIKPTVYDFMKEQKKLKIYIHKKTKALMSANDYSLLTGEEQKQFTRLLC